MINGNAPKIAKAAGAVRRTARNPDPSLHRFGHSGAQRTAARSRALLEQFVSNAERRSWIGRQQAVAYGPGTVRRRERAICRGDRGKER